jgi:hypothetical protein
MAAFRSLDDVPVPGSQGIEASAAADPPQQSNKKATPTPAKKATPTATPRKKK